jgi:TonB family protein
MREDRLPVMQSSPHKRIWLTGAIVAMLTACGEMKGAVDRLSGAESRPDSLPRMLNDSLPFQYPVALYMQLIDDSVTLHLHIDEYGRPVPESTRVAVPARYAEFDTSAMRGSRDLVFRPAIRAGKPVPYTVLFPIHFRIPTRPITGDSSAR